MNLQLKTILCTSLFACCLQFSYTAQGQTKNKFAVLLESWFDGNINFKDTTLRGFVRYNDLEGVLMYKAHDDNLSDIKSLRAFDVISFSYFDSEQNQRRSFISATYDVKENGTVVPCFFEVLKEYKRFALLSVKLPLESWKKNHLLASKYFIKGPQSVIQQREILCIFDANGNLRPYLEVTSREKGGSSKQKKREQIFNAGLLREYIGSAFAQLEEFSVKNSLSFEKKEDLLTIFDYYDTIQIE